MYVKKGQLSILAVNLVALSVFAILFFIRSNYEFVIYIGVIVFFLVLIAATNHRVYYPNALLWALKPHDDGIEHGVVVRLWNQGSSPQRFVLSTPTGRRLYLQRLTHIETPVTDPPLNPGIMADTLPPQGMHTYRVMTRD